MKDKYNLLLRENVFLAKKLFSENIYHSARMEGCNVTFPETQTILDGVSVGNLKMEDVECILNLRDAWRYVISNVGKPFNLEFVCKINSFVSRNESLDWGILRYGNVGISGTDYVPIIPIEEDVTKEIQAIMDIENITERAIRYFLWGMRSQLFWDGNKRTSTLCANKMLISEGKGLLSVKEKDFNEFHTRLTKFYNTNDYSVIEQFIYEHCIHGLEINQELKQQRVQTKNLENE